MGIILPPNHHVTRQPFSHLTAVPSKNDNARYKDSNVGPLKKRLKEIEEQIDTQVRHPKTQFHYDTISFNLGQGSVAVLRVKVCGVTDVAYHDLVFDPNQLYSHPDPLVVMGYFCEQLIGGSFDCTALRNIYRSLTAVISVIAHSFHRFEDSAYVSYYGQRRLIFIHNKTQTCVLVSFSDFFGR